MAAHSVLRDGMQGVRRSEWSNLFVSSPDTVRRSRLVREGLLAAAPAIGCCAVTCRSRSTTLQTARKTSAIWVANKSRARGVMLLGIVVLATTIVTLLAIIAI
jgi:hypothetical protein